MSTITPDETILGLLAAQPQHGYQLLEHFRDPAALGMVWNLSTSQLYAVLKRLERQGSITGCAVAQENAPPRVEYTLTPTGYDHLMTWLDDPRPSGSIRRVRVEFLSRLYIARLLNLPAAAIVSRQKTACQTELNRFLDQRAQTQPGVGYLTLELLITHLNGILQWLDRCEMTPYDPDTENRA